MGYYSSIEGTITFKKEGELKGLSVLLEENALIIPDLKVFVEAVDNLTTAMSNPVLNNCEISVGEIVFEGTHEVEGYGKYYDFKKDLQKIVDNFKVTEVNMIRSGEEQGDIEKYRLVNGKIESCSVKMEFDW